jgi:LAO/AO transport system kinase
LVLYFLLPLIQIKILKIKGKKIPIDLWISEIQRNNKVILAQAITLIESTKESDRIIAAEILKKCAEIKTKPSIRIGITGVPGVGKSTFINTFASNLSNKKNKIAILSIDPSSQNSKGSILGDKTRMTDLIKDQNVFIRPSPSGITLGGITANTLDAILIFEAAGYNYIIVETVGVGQSETAVHGITDFFLLLMLPGSGDELQGIKRGIMELADMVFINKADGDNVLKAKIAKAEFSLALHLFPPMASGWTPQVILGSAIEGTGIKETIQTIESFINITSSNGHFEKNRISQKINTFRQQIKSIWWQQFIENQDTKYKILELENAIKEGKLQPINAVNEIINFQKSNFNK